MSRSLRSARLAAAGAIASWVALVLALVLFLFDRPLDLVVTLVGALLALLGAWWIATERQWRRWVGLAATVAAVVAIVWTLVDTDEDRGAVLLKVLVMGALLAAFNLLGQYAVRSEAGTADVSAYPAIRPRHSVLIGNPWSGGGKVKSFDLEALAAELGVKGKTMDRALAAAFAELDRYQGAKLAAGREALAELDRTGQPAIVL
ncbi:MAG: hypothetical protein ACERLM_12190, partial [Acidimicrobiales bacterium]